MTSLNTCLIIEDELPAARQLTKLLLTHLPQVQILETLDSVEGAVHWLQAFPAPDVIFMDIQIADGLSFDIFKHAEVNSPVIFTTAFDQYAVQAFKVNAIDYLLKPVDTDELGRALQKVADRKTEDHSTALDQLLHYFNKNNWKDRFLVKNGQHFIVLSCTDIAFFRSSDGLTQAYTKQGKRHFIEHTLEELERLLDPTRFFRISRGVMICPDAIKAVHPHLNGRLKLDLVPTAPEDIFVSRERGGAFKVWLGG